MQIKGEDMNIKRVFWITLIIVAATVAIVASLSIREEHAAKSFIRVLQGIQLGSTSSDAIQALREKCGSHCSEMTHPCDGNNCKLAFEFDNTPLWQLRIAPFTHLGGSVSIHNSHVDYIGLVYRVSCARNVSSGVQIAQFPESQTEPAFSKSVGPVGRPPFLSVKMTPSATPEQKTSVFELNFSCLSRIGGCAGVSELVPSLTKGEHLSCRARS